MQKSNEKAELVEVVTVFLDAVKNRDGKKTMELLRGDRPMTHVLPGAKIFTNMESYSESQKHWYEGKTGFWDYKIHSIETCSEMGLASIFADYSNIDFLTTKPFKLELYISYLFRKIL
jgi:hypothetical protein